MNLLNQNLFETLKTVLKQKGITYSELANRLDMSEAGIKKIMVNGDCNISKLNEICQAIELSPTELWSLAAVQKPNLVSFTPEQEESLLRDQTLYFYFRALLNFDFDEPKTREKLKISEKKSFSNLRKLDQLKLLELHQNNQIRSQFKGHLGVMNPPKLGALNSKVVHNNFFQFAQSNFENNMKDTSMGAYSTFELREDSLKDLKKTLMDTFNEFQRRSKREKILFENEKLIPAQCLCYLTDGFDEMDFYPL